MKSSLEWCKGQKKGLRLVNPSAEFDKDKVIMLAHSAPDFVLRMRELLERISEKEINLLRTKLQK
ncbi:MAG TPA: hypothetical protein VJK72_05115 [Candidatus Nanoarchaeia archaeon]|nr:hypothetical protein [Candidatus Nanoarchaeia archaeon]